MASLVSPAGTLKGFAHGAFQPTTASSMRRADSVSSMSSEGASRPSGGVLSQAISSIFDHVSHNR
ncbi:hypothetical protein T484DRAFT_1854179 [Baffinella frigidus]|nr:hypothetical protein T484DRAFT_1854179 [Cryptophyta sp. CCMP2293]